MKKAIKLNNTDCSLDIFLNNNEKYANEYIINKNYLIDNNNNPYQEDINSKEEIIQTNDEDELENLGTGKFRFINTQAEKEINIKKRNKYINDNTNYSIENINHEKK